MAVSFSKYSCPKCGNIISDWHRSYIAFGNPFLTCDKCNMVIRQTNIDEWESMSWLKRVEYCSTYYGRNIIGLGFAVPILGLIFDEIFDTSIFINEDGPSILLIILTLLVLVLIFYITNKDFQNEIRESKKRTSDPLYRKMLGIDL